MWKQIAQRLENYQHTIWTEFTPLALKHKAINLGQGFPGYPCPEFVKDSLREAAEANENQYARSQGILPLAEELATFYSASRSIDPASEIVITHGASEALLCSFLGLVNPGEEVVKIEPVFDIYKPQISYVQGVIKSVSLASDWSLDLEALERQFTPKTKVFLFNNPHNPLGKVYTDEELSGIARILAKWPNVVVVSDEVYEHLTFDGKVHRSLCDYGDLWERSLTIGSAGKLFSVTGWKVGWVRGGKGVVNTVAAARLWTTFCSNTVCQGAIARAFRAARKPYLGFDNYFKWIQNDYQQRRDIVMNLFQDSPITVDMVKPEGGYFACGYIDQSQIEPQYLQNDTPDYAFAKWLTEKKKITCIPCSSFYSDQFKDLGRNMVRFALCKDLKDYDEAAKILKQ